GFPRGHPFLMAGGAHESGVGALSLVLHPPPFGPSEDLSRYPRDETRDLALAERVGVDLVFAPDVEEMYPGGEPGMTVDPGALGERLEGASRPGHFRGVATVVAKLFNVVGASRAYFG